MLHLDNTPHIPPHFCSQIQMSHFIFFLSLNKKRCFSSSHTEVSAPAGAVWENMLPRWAGLQVTRGLSRVPRKGKSRGWRGHHAAAPELLALCQGGPAPPQKKGRNGSFGLLPIQRMAKLAEAICSWLQNQQWGGEKKPSQQTVVTEGLCGKMVKFGLKQAVSLVMSCC